MNQEDKSLKESEHGFYTIYNREENNSTHSKSSFPLEDKCKFFFLPDEKRRRTREDMTRTLEEIREWAHFSVPLPQESPGSEDGEEQKSQKNWGDFPSDGTTDSTGYSPIILPGEWKAARLGKTL